MVNVVPFPTSLSTPIVPPNSSANFFVIDRPRPVPFWISLSDWPSTWRYSSNSVGSSFLGHNFRVLASNFKPGAQMGALDVFFGECLFGQRPFLDALQRVREVIQAR